MIYEIIKNDIYEKLIQKIDLDNKTYQGPPPLPGAPPPRRHLEAPLGTPGGGVKPFLQTLPPAGGPDPKQKGGGGYAPPAPARLVEQQLHRPLPHPGGAAAQQRLKPIVLAGVFRFTERAVPVEVLGHAVECVPAGAPDVASPPVESRHDGVAGFLGAGGDCGFVRSGKQPVGKLDNLLEGHRLRVERGHGPLQLGNLLAQVVAQATLHRDGPVTQAAGMLFRKREERFATYHTIVAGEDIGREDEAAPLPPVEPVEEHHAQTQLVAALGGNYVTLHRDAGTQTASAPQDGNAVPLAPDFDPGALQRFKGLVRLEEREPRTVDSDAGTGVAAEQAAGAGDIRAGRGAADGFLEEVEAHCAHGSGVAVDFGPVGREGITDGLAGNGFHWTGFHWVGLTIGLD